MHKVRLSANIHGMSAETLKLSSLAYAYVDVIAHRQRQNK